MNNNYWRWWLVILPLVLVSIFFMMAAKPGAARLEVINQTEQDITIVLSNIKGDLVYPRLPVNGVDIPDEMQNRALKPDEKDQLYDAITTTFTLERGIYKAEILACGLRAQGLMDVSRNLKLNFTPCDEMKHYTDPRFLGEPSMEKPNWFRAPGMADWRFIYPIPPGPASAAPTATP